MKNKRMKLFRVVCKIVTLALCICCGFFCATAQQLNDMSSEILRNKLQHANDAGSKIQILQALSKHYITKLNAAKADLDTAAAFNKEAALLSQKTKDDKNIGISILINGQIFQHRKDYSKALEHINAALQIFNKNNYKEQAGEAYVSLAQNFSDTSNMTDNAIAYYKQAIALFNAAESNEFKADAITNLAEAYYKKGDYKESIRLLQEALAIYRSIGSKKADEIYDFIGMAYFEMSDFVTAYKYEVLALNAAEAQHDTTSRLAHVYFGLGVVSSEAHKFDTALAFYQKGLIVARNCKDTALIMQCYTDMISLLPAMNRQRDALKLLDELSENYTFNTVGDKAMLEYLYLNTLMNDNKFAAAEPHMNKILALYKLGGLDAESTSNMLFVALRYYFGTAQYEKARMYLEKKRAYGKVDNSFLIRADNELWAFQIDSAEAKYPSAIKHYQLYKILMDSLNSTEKLRQYNELQVQYNSVKKDKNIQLLTKKSALQEASLQQERLVRNSIIIGLVMVLLLAALLYNRYRLKQRNNILLEKKQEEINSQNLLLKRVLGEKEWLLREIHHRVKNNLQIVISLLNTQSAYLDNEDALVAIRNSQHRMHAMSLIHQKLYQSENLASIDMHWYIHELVGYMRESFDTDRKIEFVLDVDKVELDVAQAVPLGLILNEAISNAIKYAFPNKKRGTVCISLKNKLGNKCMMAIADNGVGLPLNFDIDNSESLGMSLMKGLSDQIDGIFAVSTHNGCIIQTEFEIHQEFISNDEESDTVKQMNQ